LARSPKGYVADFVHVTAVEPQDLDVWHQEQRITGFSIVEGRETELAVVANDDTGVALAGALPYSWSSSNQDVVRIGAVGSIGTPEDGIELNDDEVRIVALASGTASLTVSRGELEKVIEITVDSDAAGDTP
jgi:hypothetical protein